MRYTRSEEVKKGATNVKFMKMGSKYFFLWDQKKHYGEPQKKKNGRKIKQ